MEKSRDPRQDIPDKDVPEGLFLGVFPKKPKLKFLSHQSCKRLKQNQNSFQGILILGKGKEFYFRTNREEQENGEL